MKWSGVVLFCLGVYGLSVAAWWFLYWLRRPRQEVSDWTQERVELPPLVVDVSEIDAYAGNGKVHNEVRIIKGGREYDAD